MSNRDFQVRALRGEEEITACARLLIETFDAATPDEVSAEAVATTAYQLSHNPDIGADGLRAVVDADNRIIAQYIIHTRNLCIGPARLPVYCIGGVAVQPDMRKHRLGSLLINESLERALSQKVPLLFLTGIAGYYHRFGYTPVLSETELCMRRDDIRRLSTSDITVREATQDDAGVLLNLYHRYMSPVLGSFDRPLDEQCYRLEWLHPHGNTRYLIASDRDGSPTGYAMLRERDGAVKQRETAAGDWPTVAALLQAHEARLPSPMTDASPEPRADELCWQTSIRSALFYALADHIPCRQETHHHPDADWMARLGDVDAYVRAMIPAWQARIAVAPVAPRSPAFLVIGAARQCVRIAEGRVTLLDAEERSAAEAAIELSPKAAAQLTFGYRPAAQIATRDDVDVPPDLVELLAVLYPQMPAGVAGSDYF